MKKRENKRKYWKRFLACLGILAMLVSCFSGVVLADSYEQGRKGSFSLTVQETDSDGNVTALSGVKLKLYKVGSVSFDGNVHFVTDQDFSSTGIDFDALESASDWFSAAQKLSGVVEKSSAAAQEAASDSNGKIVYSGLEEGMYLILGASDGEVTVTPMLLSLPYATKESGWVYDVQAFPKVEKVTDKGSIEITKRLYYIDPDSFTVIEMAADDATYKVGLFLDAQGTIPFRSDYIKEIRLVNASSGTASWDNVPDGKYYVFELDENGDPMAINETMVVEDNKTFYYNVTDPDEKESNEAVVGQSSSSKSVSYVNNYYYYIPDGFSLRGWITVEKIVKVDGQQTTVDDTFYVGVFETGADGSQTLVEDSLRELVQNGSVTIEITFPENTEPESVTYTVLETDKDGNPVDHDSFAYEVDGEGDVILNKNESYENSMIITNSKNTTTPTPTPTGTPAVTPTVTPSEEVTVTPSPNGGDGGRKRTSVKTGDDTPIGVWAGILVAAIVAGGAAGVAVRRKKKK